MLALVALLLALAGCAVNPPPPEPRTERRASWPSAEPGRATAPRLPQSGAAPLTQQRRPPASALPPYRSPTAPPPVPVAPAAPKPLTSCDPGGCWSSGADRYNGGPGGSFIDPGGRLCQRNGLWMQCF